MFYPTLVSVLQPRVAPTRSSFLPTTFRVPADRFRLARRVTFSLPAQRESNQRESAPDIRVRSLRNRTSLAPAPLRGSSRRDVPVPSFLARPCLAPPCATPALGLLTGEGVSSGSPVLKPKGAGCSPVYECMPVERWRFAPIGRAGNRVPSGGRVESPWKGSRGMDAERVMKGQGRPFMTCPWNGDGAREPGRSPGRMRGVLSLWLLSLCTSKEKVTRPGGRNRGAGALRDIGLSGSGAASALEGALLCLVGQPRKAPEGAQPKARTRATVTGTAPFPSTTTKSKAPTLEYGRPQIESSPEEQHA